MANKMKYEKAIAEVVVFEDSDKNTVRTACAEGITDTMGSTITCSISVF